MPTVVGFDSAVKKRATCRTCGAMNEYTPAEERILYQGRDISQCICTTKGFNCGNCGKEVITYSD